jgi:hypothetical protein
MRRKNYFYYWLCYALICQFTLKAQQSFIQNDILAGLSRTNAAQVWINPALLAEAEKANLSLSYENRFQIKGFQNLQLASSFPILKNQFFLGIEHQALLDYSSLKFQIGMAKKLGSHLSVAAKFHYFQNKINEYGQENHLGFGIASSLKLNTQIHFLIHFIFPLRDPLSVGNLEAQIISGIDYQFSDEIHLRALFVKTTNQAADIQFAASYLFSKQFYFRFQFKTLFNSLGFSFGSLWKNQFLINFGFQIHPHLAWSPGFNLSYQ